MTDKQITLTDEEREALESVSLMLRANLTEHMPPLQRRAVSWATETLEQLLKRSHKRKTMDKLSDEQVRVWAEEWEVECQMRLQTKQYGEWEWFGRRNDYIAHKAYAAGRESMREEAAKVCDEAAEYNQREYSKFPNSYAEGASDVADELAQTIRDLPTSGGDND